MTTLPPAPLVTGAAPAPAPRRVLGPRSLVSRLVSGVVVLVAVLVLAIGAATFVLFRGFLYNQLDTQLSNVADDAIRPVTLCLADPQNCFRPTTNTTSPPVPRAAVEWIGIVDASGTPPLRLTSQSSDLQVLSLSQRTAASLVAGNGTPQTETSTGTRLRIASRQLNVTTADNDRLYVLVGLSTEDVDDSLRRLLLLELSIGAGAVALALIASFTGVSFGLKGLRRVTNTAQEVTAELSASGTGLDRRVPVDASTDTEVGQLATSVNTLLGAVETQFAARVRSEERMREFLADASHELRTPLTSIRGFAELSRMQRRQTAARAGLPADDDDALDRIESEGTRMSKLVDDLLLLARSDHGAPAARERVDVAAMVHDVVDSARVAHPDRPIDSAVPPGLAVLGDRDQLLRVVRNLVTNAAVHTAPGGPILVSAHADGEEIVIQVADSGPGLTPEQAAHVFERFWRADKARTRVRGGSGLGMSIVATIVEHHQGAVRFESTPETGSTVTVVLPAAPRV